ncbi:MAG: hypothetical protein ACRELY_15315 [Polyangiaceae bacterium]
MSELIAFFTPSLGEEKARETVHGAIARLRFEGKTVFDRAQSLRLLEELAREEGIVGVAARFAKARILLRHF